MYFEKAAAYHLHDKGFIAIHKAAFILQIDNIRKVKYA
jgi:hypothetical protein